MGTWRSTSAPSRIMTVPLPLTPTMPVPTTIVVSPIAGGRTLHRQGLTTVAAMNLIQQMLTRHGCVISNPADHYMYGSCNRLEKATHNRAKIQELTGFDMNGQEWANSGQSWRRQHD